MKSIIVVICLALGLVSCKINLAPSAAKFIAFEQQYGMRFDFLIQRVHNKHLRISYNYADDCPTKAAGRVKKLEDAITTALNTWLKPLRALKTTKPIVSDFRYQLDDGRTEFDLRVLLHCVWNTPHAMIHTAQPPEVYMRRGTKVDQPFRHTIVHEIGHTFGLADTYVGRYEENPSSSTGGLQATSGKQPPSIMTIHAYNFPSLVDPFIGEDDRRGIIWLYKLYYEGLQTTDCLFADYMYEKHPRGCHPKYPLIFETKYGNPELALKLLAEDPKIDVNAQDKDGMTALHYATRNSWKEVVQALLAHKDINPHLKDKQERNALQLARELHLAKKTELLQQDANLPDGTEVEDKLAEIIVLLQQVIEPIPVAPPPIIEDVNQDGQVNILDLVTVAANFNKKGKNKADVNQDGVVDIRDLVLVANKMQEDTSSAPLLRSHTAKHLTHTVVRGWLAQARKLPHTQPAYQRGIAVLEQLLASTAPAQHALLANYPNPFNPETWLPYQLAQPAQVTILIHAADGKHVRTLVLGNQPAGAYQDKSRAAYWDGRNTQGEPVASGVYFYTLSASGFTATRKMLLQK